MKPTDSLSLSTHTDIDYFRKILRSGQKSPPRKPKPKRPLSIQNTNNFIYAYIFGRLYHTNSEINGVYAEHFTVDFTSVKKCMRSFDDRRSNAGNQLTTSQFYRICADIRAITEIK